MMNKRKSESPSQNENKRITFCAPNISCCSSTSTAEVSPAPSDETISVSRRRSLKALRMYQSCDLPPEILSYIFQYLPSPDWKNARLVCKLWCSCATVISFTKKLKFVFRESERIPDDLGQILKKSNFTQFNLEFQYVLTNWISSDVWMESGQKIESVQFFFCNICLDTLHKIIKNCVNLTSIRIYGSGDEFHNYRHNNVDSLDILDYCITQKTTHLKLHTFSIHMDQKLVGTNIFKKIFAVFPNLKHFTSNIRDYQFDDEYDFHQVEPALQLESLRFWPRKYSDKGAFWMETTVLPIQQFRLTEFDTTMSYVEWTDSRKEILFEFFTSQNNLQVIYLELGPVDFIKELIFHILTKCQNVSRLVVVCNNSVINLSCTEITKFFQLIANLRCLVITAQFKIESLPPVSLSKLALEALFLNNVSKDQHTEFYMYLLKHCLNIQHISLTLPCDNFLQEIFKSLHNLKTLIFVTNSDCKISTKGFLEQGGSSIKQLQKLEHLEITCHLGFCTKGVENISSEFQFPRLKYLRLDFKAESISYRTLYCMLSNMPELESLDLPLYQLETLRETVKLCKCFKNLRCLAVRKLAFIPYDRRCSALKPVFNMLPTLRYVSIYSEEEEFSYDSVDKIILRSSQRNYKGYKFSRNESIFKKFGFQIHYSQV